MCLLSIFSTIILVKATVNIDKISVTLEIVKPLKYIDTFILLFFNIITYICCW